MPQNLKTELALLFLAKAALQQAQAHLTRHWGMLLQAVGKTACHANHRYQDWTTAYENMDGVGCTSINVLGHLEENEEAFIREVDALLLDVNTYRTAWNGFHPEDRDQNTHAFDEAMDLLEQVEDALREAKGYMVQQEVGSTEAEAVLVEDPENP